ncbi:hypothetical protein [Dysosmobacter sp. HCP28S3_G4]|uniref:hypothetical protein n=1 Tax=Dysosmobacter sp. HCP28S3_G4 TaxID=3438938 RepID=UPI003F8AB933
MVGLSKELTYGIWITDEETDMTATLLSTFNECLFMGHQLYFKRNIGYYSRGFQPAFIGRHRINPQVPLEEFEMIQQQ